MEKTIILLLVLVSTCLADPVWYTVFNSGGKYVVKQTKDQHNGIAFASFDDALYETGM
jgi:hypothetical protein